MRQSQITGAILAGGRATRMGGQDKGLLLLNNKALWRHIFEKIAPQVGSMMISAHRHLEEYKQSTVPVIHDSLPDYPGPLAGMLAIMEVTTDEWILFCPCDVPNIPDNLVWHLWQNKGSALTVWVNDGERDHPTIALIHKSVKHSLREYLLSGERRVMCFLKQSGGHPVVFHEDKTAFANVNTPEDLNSWQQGE